MPVNIQLRVIRDNSNSLKDEIFTVSKGTHNDWRINHKSAFSASNSTLFLSDRTSVLEYFQNVFALLKVDDEKFHFVQLDAPCYPVVMVSRADILAGDKETFNNLMQVVESVLYNWPYDVQHWTAGDQ
jgi:hypothetical protein